MNEVKRTRSKLLIVGGIIEIALSFICMAFGVFATSIFLTETLPQDYQYLLQNAVGVVGLAAFGFGFAGAICAFKRKYPPFAVLGTAFIMVWAILVARLALIAPSGYDRLTGMMFSMFIFIFSIISLSFIAVSRKDFENDGVKP